MLRAYDTRRVCERTLYRAACKKCMAEVEGELKEFNPISRFTYHFHCPSCGGNNTINVLQLHPLHVIEGRTEIQKLEV